MDEVAIARESTRKHDLEPSIEEEFMSNTALLVPSNTNSNSTLLCSRWRVCVMLEQIFGPTESGSAALTSLVCRFRMAIFGVFCVLVVVLCVGIPLAILNARAGQVAVVHEQARISEKLLGEAISLFKRELQIMASALGYLNETQAKKSAFDVMSFVGLSKEDRILYASSLIALSYNTRLRSDDLVSFQNTFKCVVRNTSNQAVAVSNDDVLGHFPVTFIQPLRGNEAALCFDLVSESSRRSAMLQAVSKCTVAFTHAIPLVQSTTSFASLIFAPVFLAPESVFAADRGCQVTGSVSGVVSVDKFVVATVAVDGVTVAVFGSQSGLSCTVV